MSRIYINEEPAPVELKCVISIFDTGPQAGHHVRVMHRVQPEEGAEGGAHQPPQDGLRQGPTAGAGDRATHTEPDLPAVLQPRHRQQQQQQHQQTSG